MRLASAVFTLLFTLLTVPSFAQSSECDEFAKEVVAVALRGQGKAEFASAVQMQLENPASASVERVERLVFTMGAGEVTVDALPSYYSKGQCELKSLNIIRE